MFYFYGDFKFTEISNEEEMLYLASGIIRIQSPPQWCTKDVYGRIQK